MFEFDLANLGAFALTVLIPGVVQSAKEHFGVEGKWSFVLAAVLGVFFVGLGEVYAQGLLPAWLAPWIEVAVVGLAGGLAASGYYDLLIKPLKNKLSS
jgi:hypothetical protein